MTDLDLDSFHCTFPRVRFILCNFTFNNMLRVVYTTLIFCHRIVLVVPHNWFILIIIRRQTSLFSCTPIFTPLLQLLLQFNVLSWKLVRGTDKYCISSSFISDIVDYSNLSISKILKKPIYIYITCSNALRCIDILSFTLSFTKIITPPIFHQQVYVCPNLYCWCCTYLATLRRLDVDSLLKQFWNSSIALQQ